MKKSIIIVLTAIVLITAVSFGGYTYIQGFVYHEYNVKDYEVSTEINADTTTITFTLDKSN